MKDLQFQLKTIGRRDAAEQWADNLTVDQQRVAEAATAAFRAGGELAKVRARANIAEAGFSKRWQNALRVQVYPQTRASLRPALYLWHKIPYAGVFEDGETIKGQPFLWVPVEGLVRKFGKGERLTPSSFERATGQQLVSFNDPRTGTPILGVRIKVPRTGKFTLSLSRLRRGTSAAKGVESTVPIFVGLRQVHDPKKFNIEGVMESVAGELPGLYTNNREEG